MTNIINPLTMEKTSYHEVDTFDDDDTDGDFAIRSRSKLRRCSNPFDFDSSTSSFLLFCTMMIALSIIAFIMICLFSFAVKNVVQITSTFGKLTLASCQCQLMTDNYNCFVTNHNGLTINITTNQFNSQTDCYITDCFWDDSLKECYLHYKGFDPYSIYFEINNYPIHETTIFLIWFSMLFVIGIIILDGYLIYKYIHRSQNK